jgi:hypothetical protein
MGGLMGEPEPDSTDSSHAYYVYALFDPRDSPPRPFYIGKGVGERMHDHGREEGESSKLRRIRAIKAAGHVIWTGVQRGNAYECGAANSRQAHPERGQSAARCRRTSPDGPENHQGRSRRNGRIESRRHYKRTGHQQIGTAKHPRRRTSKLSEPQHPWCSDARGPCRQSQYQDRCTLFLTPATTYESKMGSRSLVVD